MTTDVAVLWLRMLQETANVRPKFRMSRFSWITWKFRMSGYAWIFQMSRFCLFEADLFRDSPGLLGTPEILSWPVFPDIMSFRNVWVHPNLSNVPFFFEYHVFDRIWFESNLTWFLNTGFSAIFSIVFNLTTSSGLNMTANVGSNMTTNVGLKIINV